MISIENISLATRPYETQVVPSVNQYRRSESFFAELPNETNHERRKYRQEQPRRTLMESMQQTEYECSQEIGEREITESIANMLAQQGMKSSPKNSFLSDRRYNQQCKETDGFASVATQCNSSLSRHPGTDGAANQCQNIENKSPTLHMLNGVKHGVRMIAVAFLLLPITSAFAVLGEHENSINVDTVRMHAKRTVSSLPLYSISDLTSVDGSRIRQFVSSDGNVFAVSWNTMYKPDFSKLLGNSFPSYVNASHEAALQPGIQRLLRHEGLDVVVMSTSHLNVFSGFAFRRSMLPRGLGLESIGME